MTTQAARKRAGRPRRTVGKPAADPRQEILVAASRLFSENSYGGTQLKEIADAAGLQTPSLYHYFSNKDEILQALLNHANKDSEQFVRYIFNGKGRASVKLRNVLVRYVSWLTSGPYAFWFLVGTAPRNATADTEFGQRYEKMADGFRTLLVTAIDEGDFRAIDPDFALHMIWGTVSGAMNMYNFQHISSPEDAANFAIRALARDPQIADEIIHSGLSELTIV